MAEPTPSTGGTSGATAARPLRVLHVLSQRPGRSGSGVFLQAMVREGAANGYDQHVVAAGPRGTTAAELPPLRESDFTLAPFPSDGAPFDLPGNSDVMPYPSTVFSEMSERQLDQYEAVIREALESARGRFEPDVVHTHHLWLMTSIVRDAFRDVPVVATSHHAELRQVVKAPRVAARARSGIRALDRIGVLTPQSVRDVTEVFGIDAGKVVVTGAGYDRDVFGSSGPAPAEARRLLMRTHGIALPPGPVVTFVGRLSTAKGVPFLVRAVTRLAAGKHPARLVLVGATGSGKDGERVSAEVREAGDAVVHTGAVAPETVAMILRASDLFVLPSLFEGLGLSMLEAAATGCPCLLSGLPTIRSWVPQRWVDEGHFRFVRPLATHDADVPVEDDVHRFVADLADAIAAMLRCPRSDEDRRALSGLLVAHSWSSVHARYRAVYEDVCGVTESRARTLSRAD